MWNLAKELTLRRNMIIVVELSKGIDPKAEYDGQRAREIFIHIRSVKGITIWLVAITVRRKIDSCLLILIEESYINKESEKQLRSRYDQFISSAPICCCGIKSVRSKVVSFESSIEIKGQFIEKGNCLTKPSAFP